MQEFREQYLAGRERMHPELERLVKENETTLSDNNAFPQIDAQGNRINFEELSAYKRFVDIVAKVKHYTGVQDLSNPQALMQLQGMLMQTFQQIVPIQQQHKEALERLSIDLVVTELEIPNGAFQFDAKLVGMGEINKDKFQQDSEEPSQEEIEESFGEGYQGGSSEMAEDETANDVFDKEKNKRRFTNALIQGSAKKGHYMFELVRNELNQMHPNLSNMYGIVMSINDLMYWMMPDEQMKRMAGDSVNGEEEVDTETDPPTIKARGILFPILVHELIKGVFDVFGTHGLPDDPKSQQMIMNSTDTLTNEMWDLRLGGFFWERLVNMFPMSLFEEGNKHIQHYLFARLVALETNEFNEVFQDIMMNNADGKKFVEDMVYDIEKDINERAMNEALGQFDFRIEEDDEEEGFGLYERGDEVGWKENALEELQEFEGDDDLEITMSSGYLFHASNGNAEYLVFKSYDDAYDYAYQMVNQDLVDNPEYFNQDWLFNFVDIDGAKSFLSDVYDEWNYSYANDIKMESDSKYSNRLISEMVDAGLMDDEDAESEDAESSAEYLIDDFVEYMTNSQIDEGRGGLDYYESNFGEEQTMEMIRENNLIDIDEATEGAIDEDGVAHFISSYDGNEIDLPSGYYAYRTN
jgi:hypothetical protein